MRDEREITSQVVQRTEHISGAWGFNTTRTHRSLKTLRADPISGSRRGDGFRLPTFYNSFYGSCKNNSYDYVSASGFRRLTGNSSSSDFVTTLSHYGSGANLVPTPTLNHQNRVEAELRNKLKRGDLNLAVMIAEANKAGVLILDTSLVLLQMLKALRERRYYDIARILRVVRPRGLRTTMSPQQAFLAYQYGWRPLVQDMYNVADALRSKWENYPPLSSASRVLIQDYGPPTGGLIINKGGECNVGVEMKVYYAVENAFLHNLASIGLINPTSVAWELTKYSFLIDWIFPFGTFLENLDATIGLEFYTGYETRFINADFWCEYQHGTSSSTKFGSGTPPRLETSFRSMRRLRMGGFPQNKVYVKLGALSNRKMAILAALLSSRR